MSNNVDDNNENYDNDDNKNDNNDSTPVTTLLITITPGLVVKTGYYGYNHGSKIVIVAITNDTGE